MKYLSVFFLIIYLSTTVFTSVGKMFDYDLLEVTTNQNEKQESEETSFNFTDFISSQSFLFLENNGCNFISQKSISFEKTNDSIHLSSYISIFSPPPEV